MAGGLVRCVAVNGRDAEPSAAGAGRATRITTKPARAIASRKPRHVPFGQ
jgi:hypothetical protein